MVIRPASRALVSRTLVALVLVVPFVLAVACGGGGGGASPEQVAAGQKVFLGTCATCHGKDANGLPKLGKNLHNNEFVQGKTNDELVAFVMKGRPAYDPANTRHVDMPPRGGNPALTDQDLANVVAFVRTLQQ